jgi:hypothetical protein
MSHEIWNERFFARKPAWHGLGDIEDVKLSAPAAIKRAKADYQVTLQPLMVDLGGVATSIGDKIAIVREPTADDDNYHILGYANPNYGLIQNVEIGEMLDPLTKEWPVETCGVLYNGRQVFMVLNAGVMDIKGDPVEQFFTFNDVKDGRTAASMMFTPVRQVCKNTFIMGQAAAIAKNLLVHHSDVQQEIEWRVAILKELQQVQHKIMHNFELFAETALKARAAKKFIEAVYPYPKKPAKVRLAEELGDTANGELEGFMKKVESQQGQWDNRCARVDVLREASYERYKAFNDEIEQRTLAESLWAGYNAVIEVEDYREGKAGDETGMLVSALFGERALTKRRAYNEAMAIVR